MPLLQIIKCNEGWGGIWHITESFDELCCALPRAEFHRAHAFRRFASERRRLEYVTVRMLVYMLTGEDKEIDYSLSGHPLLSGENLRISISHTQGYATVLFSRDYDVGVDIEVYSDRVRRLKDRLIGPEEPADTTYEILLHWSAKETVFKILDEEGIDFWPHLRVEGLTCPAQTVRPETSGDFFLSYHLSDGKSGCVPVHYETTRDFVFTYAFYKL